MIPVHAESETGPAPGWFSDFRVLTKARVNSMVVATTLVGFALHDSVLSGWFILLQTLAGTALLAGSAAVANQVLEQSFDQQMARTRNRPLAAGRLQRSTAVWLGGAMLLTGSFWLGSAVNLRAMALAVLAFFIYVFAYTPMKRTTPVCTFVGSVSGALPVLVGWAATGAAFGHWAFLAFIVLFLWQFPHFLAIAWWRRSQYQQAGYRILRNKDTDGFRTAAWALGFTMLLFATSLLPTLWHLVSDWYGPLVLILGFGFGLFAVRFLVRRTEAAARRLFLASLVYLPALYLLILLCEIKK